MGGATALKTIRIVLLAGVAALVLGGCAANRGGTAPADVSGQTRAQPQQSIVELMAFYRANPLDRAAIIRYADALRAAGQPEQAASVLENGIAAHPDDVGIKVAYAKALTAAGRLDQALNIANAAIDPATPDWNALLVKGAILDQSGRSEEARAVYRQGLLIAPGEASLEANLGLSYTMTNDLVRAEQHLRRAAGMRGANTTIRQNLALVVGLQGRLDESRELFARELVAEQVEANMAYIRSLLTQQNRWDLIRKG